MAFLRPEAVAQILRWREALGALFAIAIGLWMLRDSGSVVRGVGVVVALVGAGLFVNALRRLRFATADDAPGVVVLDEGQVSYLGPVTGGAIALRDLAVLRLRSDKSRKIWFLIDTQGNALAIPHGAKGEAALFDAFAALPGMDMTELLAKLEAKGDASVVVWQRTGASTGPRLTSPSSQDSS
ncbi:MAG: hypothetical protein AAGF50_05775 [Pseudomonadota bacterium]